MSSKRKLPSSTDSTSAKRPCRSYADGDDADEMKPGTTSHERPRNHPVYGQRSAFPGLDDAAEDELFYGPAEDGMEYLRMVRSEANSLPLLFTASESAVPEPSIQETDEQKEYEDDDQIGAFSDGVYVAPQTGGIDGAALQLNELEDRNLYPETQASYYNLLRHRFLLLRSTLKCAPPLPAISALDESHPISFPRHSGMAKKEWRRLVLAVDPQMVQLACMDVDSVLGVLGIMARLMSENFRSGDVERVRRIGAWAWGLLGKCREVGQLGTEEVGEIRDLGKRAVKILQKMNEDERNKLAMRGVSSEHEQVAWEVEDTGRSTADVFGRGAQIAESDAGELEAAKSRLQARLHSEDPDLETGSDDPQPEITAADAETAGNTEGKTALAKQTHAMLDMIITVVGEFYGQRDLLRAREVWEESMTD